MLHGRDPLVIHRLKYLRHATGILSEDFSIDFINIELFYESFFILPLDKIVKYECFRFQNSCFFCRSEGKTFRGISKIN